MNNRSRGYGFWRLHLPHWFGIALHQPIMHGRDGYRKAFVGVGPLGYYPIMQELIEYRSRGGARVIRRQSSDKFRLGQRVAFPTLLQQVG